MCVRVYAMNVPFLRKQCIQKIKNTKKRKVKYYDDVYIVVITRTWQLQVLQYVPVRSR